VPALLAIELLAGLVEQRVLDFDLGEPDRVSPRNWHSSVAIEPYPEPGAVLPTLEEDLLSLSWPETNPAWNFVR